MYRGDANAVRLEGDVDPLEMCAGQTRLENVLASHKRSRQEMWTILALDMCEQTGSR